MLTTEQENPQKPAREPDQEVCDHCWKDKRLCLCPSIKPVQTRLEVLVLQHPREAANPWGTARLLTLGLKKSTHRIGLSWRSLSDALGLPAKAPKPEPKHWAVLYLGTRADAKKKLKSDDGITITRKDRAPSAKHDLKGIIILDGNWKQSKTLWWRNAWLLKLNRLFLDPTRTSEYGRLRRQPRKGCLSSIEAAAECLVQLGEDASVDEHLQNILDAFLKKTEEVTSSELDS